MTVKRPGRSLATGFKSGKVLSIEKSLRLILQVFRSPSKSCIIELTLNTA